VDVITYGNTCRNARKVDVQPLRKGIANGEEGLTFADVARDIRTCFVFKLPRETMKVRMSPTESANVRPAPPDAIPFFARVEGLAPPGGRK
jgi:hypothetical protein